MTTRNVQQSATISVSAVRTVTGPFRDIMAMRPHPLCASLGRRLPVVWFRMPSPKADMGAVFRLPTRRRAIASPSPGPEADTS